MSVLKRELGASNPSNDPFTLDSVVNSVQEGVHN